MAIRRIAAVALALTLASCTHVHPIDPAAPGPELEGLNRTLKHRRVSIETFTGVSHRAGAAFPAERVRVAPDSTLMTLLLEPRRAEALFSVPYYAARRDTVLSTSVVSRMTVTNRFRGALDGFVVGLGVGALCGTVYHGVDGLTGGTWGSTGAYALLFGMLGSIVGSASGVVGGSHEVYDFAGR